MRLLRLLLPACLLGAPAMAAETCSTSTLVSPVFATARWCGEPPGPGTLRMARRDGQAAEFLAVPLDTFREVVRTPGVAAYVAKEVEPRFRRMPAATPRPALAERRLPRAPEKPQAEAKADGAAHRPACAAAARPGAKAPGCAPVLVSSLRAQGAAR